MFGAISEAFSRRDLMKLSSAGLFGASVSSWLDVVAGRGLAQAAEGGKKPKSCIVLFMSGGPSHAHTFDLKPGGHYKPIQTSAPGVEISEHLPKVAQQMHHVAVVRGMSTGDANHQTAHYLMRTGFRKGTGGLSYPHFGAIANNEIIRPDNGMPNFVVLKPGSGSVNGCGAGYLGAKYSPLILKDVSRGIENLKPAGEMAAFDRKAALLDQVDQDFLRDYQAEAIKAHRAGYQRAVDLMHLEKAANAFRIDQEPEHIRKMYGTGVFADQCLGARRLVEAGVPFVEVMHPAYWDTHGGAEQGQKKLSDVLDQPMAALLADLADRGMLESTLVIWMGEFGRDFKGSNHHARAWSTCFAGAGVRGGQVIGRTDAKAMTVEDRPVRVQDFVATVLKALDVDYTKEREMKGRPVGTVDKDPDPVNELFS